MAPTRIAFCITELDAGGAERILAELATGLDRAEWEPRVFALGPPGPYASVIRDAGVPVECFDGLYAWDAPRVLWRLRRALRAFRPAILQTFLFHANIIGRIAGWSAGVPRILSGVRVAERRSRFYGRIDRWTNGLVDRNVCVSRGVAEYCERECGFDPRKTVVIPNGVAARLFGSATACDWSTLQVPTGRRVILTIGRLDPQKGLDDLLRAFRRVCDHHGDVHLVIVGEGPERARLEALTTELKLSACVTFTGRRSDVAALLSGATLFVLASRWEGMANVLLEAMAAARPIIATAVEGTAELIIENVTGWLVPAGDPAALNVAITHVLDDPEHAAVVGCAAQGVVSKQFTTESMVARYAALYRELISNDAETTS